MMIPPQAFGQYRLLLILLLCAGLLQPYTNAAQQEPPPPETIEVDPNHGAFDPIEGNNNEQQEPTAEANASQPWSVPPQGIWEADSLRHLRSQPGYGYMSWIDSLIRSRKPEAPPNLPTGSGRNFEAAFWLRILLFVLLGLVLLWVVGYFFLGKRGLFTGSKKYESEEASDLAETPETADNNTLQKAIAEGDYRRAVRLLFLLSLDHLHQQGYISMAPQKTNQHYLSEIADPALRKEFARMVLQYEYVWFGHFELSADQFQRIYQPFKSFLSR